MRIEFQLSAARMFALLRNRLRTVNICVDEDFEHQGQTCILDRIEFQTDTSIQTVPTTVDINVASGGPVTIDSRDIRIAQPIRLPIVTIADLRAANGQPATPILEPVITLFFRVYADISPGGTPRTCIAADGVDLGPLGELAPELASFIEDELDFSSCSSLPLGPIEDMLDTEVTVANVGLTVVDGSRFVIRMEVGDPPANAAAWTDFHAGNIDDLLAGSDWGMLVDKDLVVESAVQRITNGLNDSDKMDLVSGPVGAWSAPGGVGHVAVTFDGVVEDACWCAIGVIPFEVDVDVDVSIDIDFRVNDPNVLRMEAHVDWEKDFWETACCTLTAALMWPLVGALMLEQEKVNFGEFLGGLVAGPAGVFIASLVAANSQGPDADAIDGDCEKIDDHNLLCTETINIPASPLFGTMTMNSTAGIAAGLVLRGSLANVPEPTLPQLVTSDIDPFAWTMERPCSSSTQTATGVVTMTKSGDQPLHICAIETLNDPLHVFNPQLDWVGAQLEFVMKIVVMPAAYIDDPYACELLVRTNAGARLVTLGPVPAAPEVDVIELSKWQATHCWKFQHQLWGKLFNPKWHVDPAPYDNIIEHLWQVEIVGVELDESAFMTDPAGTEIAVAAPSIAGIVRFGAIVPPGAIDGEVGLSVRSGEVDWAGSDARLDRRDAALAELAHPTRGGNRPRTTGAAVRQLNLSQSLLLRDAKIGLPGTGRAVVAGRGPSRQPMLAVATTRGVAVYDLSVPATPVLVDVLPGRGARFEGGGLTTWGSRGVTRFPWRGSASTISTTPAASVTCCGGHRYVASDDRLVVCDGDWQPRAETRFDHAVHDIAVNGRALAVAHDDGVQIYDLSGPMTSRPVTTIAGGGFRSIEAVRTPRSGRAFFARGDGGGGSLFDLSDPRRPVEMARYASDPWFMGAARVGSIFARFDHDRTHLAISTVARTVPAGLGWSRTHPHDPKAEVEVTAASGLSDLRIRLTATDLTRA